MRWMIALLVLATAAGCGVSRDAQLDGVEASVARGRGISFSGGGEPAVGEMTVRYILLDLDSDAVKRLEISDGPSDIKPRRFQEPKGEFIAAAILEHGAGEVVDCGEWKLREAEPLEVKASRRVVYLRDWSSRPRAESESADWVPEIDTVEDGFHGRLTAIRAGTEISLTLDSESMQVLSPVPEFDLVNRGDPTWIQIPGVATMHRVAVESVMPGETAMFQLSRAGGTRVRLLFLRVVPGE